MKLAPLAISIALLAGVAWETGARPRPEDAAPFHRRVREFFDSLPYRVGPWVGTDHAPTPAAQQLLRPNVLVSRSYRNAETGKTASLLFVHCRDSRDMSGHYPPVCYPAHGWRGEHEVSEQVVRVGSMDIPIARYVFERSGFNRHQKIVIAQAFVLPRRGFATTMDAVRTAASDYPTRAFGAAQVQVVMSAGLREEEERATVRELLAPLAPVFAAIANEGDGRSGGGATP